MTEELPPSAHPAPSEDPGACWLCGDLRGIAVHVAWSERRGKPLWTAHEYPSGDPHPVEPCPVCASGNEAARVTGPAAPSSLPAEEDFRTALTGLVEEYALHVQSGCPAAVLARVMDEARIRFNTETRERSGEEGRGRG